VLRKILAGTGAFIVVVWLLNTSLLATAPEGAKPRLIAHRGVHQIFSSEDLDNDTCTAERIFPPTHEFLENTLPSMQAAFEKGAGVVELDIQLTPDGEFAVFHDWTLDCRTNGSGVTHETAMARLKELDIGYGYTADGGKTFPFRGKDTGMMPTLKEVLGAFPDGKFLLNFKSQRVEEAAALARMLEQSPVWRETVIGVYGGSIPTRESIRLIPNLRGYDKQSAVSCLAQYLAYGWTGIVPGPCQNALVIVPANYAWLLWGWPHRFTERMREAGSEVILLGPYGGGGFTSGIDDPEQIDLIPDDFDGYVWTNRIETVGPILRPEGGDGRFSQLEEVGEEEGAGE